MIAQTRVDVGLNSFLYSAQCIECFIPPIVDEDRHCNARNNKNKKEQHRSVHLRCLRLNRSLLQNVAQNGAVVASALVRIVAHFRELSAAMEAGALRQPHYDSHQNETAYACEWPRLERTERTRSAPNSRSFRAPPIAILRLAQRSRPFAPPLRTLLRQFALRSSVPPASQRT